MITLLTALSTLWIGGGCGDEHGLGAAGDQTPGLTLDAGGDPEPVTASDAGPGQVVSGGQDAGLQADGGGSGSQQCLAGELLQELGFSRMLVGGDFDDTTAPTAPFDIRYHYLAGGIPDGDGTCSSCTAACANPEGKTWWGCWQDTSRPPGDYLRRFLSKAADQRHLPLITYYELLDASRAAEGAPQVAAMANASLMRRYFNDFRFMLQQVGGARMLLHLEPDLWGYLQRAHDDPRQVPVAVASANESDCTGMENTAAGFGACLVKMVRAYAPNTQVGLHASGWATGVDALYNQDPAHDVAADAAAVARFLEAVAPDADFVTVDPSDRDAGYYQSTGKNKWWDASDATLPNYRQAFAWAKALTDAMGKPALWWQLPLGNMNLPNAPNRWKDNRVDTLFARTEELAASNAFAMVYGAGRADQTKPSTDDGNLSARVRTYVESGGVASCPTP